MGFIFKFFLCLFDIPITFRMLNCDLCDALLLFLHPWNYFPHGSLLWWVHFYKVVSFQVELWFLWCLPLVFTPWELVHCCGGFTITRLLIASTCVLHLSLGTCFWQFPFCTRPICSWRLFWCWFEKCKSLCHLCTLGNFWLSNYGSLGWQLISNCFEELRNLNEELELKFWLSLFWVYFSPRFKR